ncbi:hypothetical protein LOAG_15717 [Loa loa]|uniref:Uncharacterized protein n=1 Tax=Loa loa TaxID=7209 RepID=A0A1S0TF58_LOALO|nr:hypothetical protein LOAG_15717 [Loa loa]EFO12814.1 hypothetical protein LOAG_15717 [Loa loa]
MIFRSPDPKSASSFMGSASNIPFMPGGFDAEIENVLRLSDVGITTDENLEEESIILYRNFFHHMRPNLDFASGLRNLQNQLKYRNKNL